MSRGDLAVGAMIAFASGALLMDVAHGYDEARAACVRPAPALAPLICEHYQALSRPCPKGINA